MKGYRRKAVCACVGTHNSAGSYVHTSVCLQVCLCLQRTEDNLGYHSSGVVCLDFGDKVSYWPETHQVG